MPDALPAATLPVNPVLGPAPEYTGYISQWLRDFKRTQKNMVLIQICC